MKPFSRIGNASTTHAFLTNAAGYDVARLEPIEYWLDEGECHEQAKLSGEEWQEMVDMIDAAGKIASKEPPTGGWMIDDGLVRQQDMIARLVENLDKPDRHWCAVGIEDEDGFAESVAYCHPDNAKLVAASPSLHRMCSEFLGFIKMLRDATPEEAVDLLTNTFGEDLEEEAEEALAKLK